MPPLDRESDTLQVIATTTAQLTTTTGSLRFQLSKGSTKVITKVIDQSLLLNHVPGITYLFHLRESVLTLVEFRRLPTTHLNRVLVRLRMYLHVYCLLTPDDLNEPTTSLVSSLPQCLAPPQKAS